MKKAIIFTLLISIISLGSCNRNSESTKGEMVDGDTSISKVDTLLLSQGFQLLETNCFSCHNPDAAHNIRVAPPMMAIKKQYVTGRISAKEFTNTLIAFINDPKAENAKLENAVEKFGVMPKMDFDQKQLEAIAAYIYQAEFEKPGWYRNNYSQEKKRHMRQNMHESYLDKGRNLAMQTKSVLGKNLLAALKEKGTEGALEFCSTRAIQLTDSMSIVLNASIRRVSDKNRNPNNAASLDELVYIEKAKSQLQANGQAEPMMTKQNGRRVGYYPIITNQMCLQCHGKKESDISLKTQEILEQRYPEDQATGYNVDQLRGIWVVELDES